MGDRHGAETERDDRADGERRISWLELATSALGLLMTLGMLAFIGWDALSGGGNPPPVIVVSRGDLTPAPSAGLYILQFEAVNRSPRTAERVEIEGVLRRGGETVETSRAVLDFVPGGSTRHGGLFFKSDPGAGEVELRALGYSEP